MSAVSTLIQSKIRPDASFKAIFAAGEVKNILTKLEGFVGFSLWTREGSSDEFLIVVEFDSLSSSDFGLQAIAESPLATAAALDHSVSIPDITPLVTELEKGVTISGSPQGTFLSLSHRVADPGFQIELRQDLERIFTELESLHGLVGWSVCHQLNLDEAVYGIVLWKSKEAFVESLPKKSSTQLQLFRRTL